MQDDNLPASHRAHTAQLWPVATISEIHPGARKMVEVKGRSIGVFNIDDEYIAVLNFCPHELAPICLGRVSGTTLPSLPGEYHWGREGEILSCPWHGWEFDLQTGRALANDTIALRRYPVRVEGGTVYIVM